MNRIEAKFKELKKRKDKALIAYITVGYPSLAMTEKLIIALERSKVDIIELGVPFSDPLADGPTIQKASESALKKGVKLADAFGIVRSIRKISDIPIAFMLYYNIILRRGIESFVRECATSGVDGIIVPDLPLEEADPLIQSSRRQGVATILLAAPTSTKDRIRRIARSSTGFVYYVSVTGVTGARRRLPPNLIAEVRAVKASVKKPMCVGFGVSSPDQARALSAAADGVIVGSALIRTIERNIDKRDLPERVSRFARTLAKAVHRD